ncbi:MAG: winged helix-turn-helix domain-containing protein [Pyrinomonadaceae bacterium]
MFADGVPLHLPAKEFETLLLLVENNGRALSKEEMLAAVWQDAFVEEGNLAKQISRLRKLFNTNGQQFIETLPKHGYRFTADLRLVTSEPEMPVILEKRTVKRLTLAIQENDENKLLSPGREEKLPHSDQRSVPLRVLLIASILLLTLVGAWFYLRNSDTSKNPENTSAVKSIAVLPFKSVKAGDDEYLRLGLTDAIVTKLSNLKQIVVRPTNAVRKYDAQDPLTAGRELGVDAVLDGTFSRSDRKFGLLFNS